MVVTAIAAFMKRLIAVEVAAESAVLAEVAAELLAIVSAIEAVTGGWF